MYGQGDQSISCESNDVMIALFCPSWFLYFTLATSDFLFSTYNPFLHCLYSSCLSAPQVPSASTIINHRHNHQTTATPSRQPSPRVRFSPSPFPVETLLSQQNPPPSSPLSFFSCRQDTPFHSPAPRAPYPSYRPILLPQSPAFPASHPASAQDTRDLTLPVPRHPNRPSPHKRLVFDSTWTLASSPRSLYSQCQTIATTISLYDMSAFFPCPVGFAVCCRLACVGYTHVPLAMLRRTPNTSSMRCRLCSRCATYSQLGNNEK